MIAPIELGIGVADQTTFLRGDGVWAVPPSASGAPSEALYVVGATHGGLSAELLVTGNTWITGDTTVAGQVKFNIVNASIGTTQIENDSITYAKIQNVTDARLLGRAAGSAGDAQELTVGTGLALSGGSLSSTVTGGSGQATVVKGNTQSRTAATALIEVSGLSFSLTSGTTYHYEFYVRFGSSVTTTGIRLGVSFPASNWNTCYACIPIAANGTASHLEGQITASGQSVTGTGVAVVNTDYLAQIIGTINPSSSGNLTVHFDSEIAGTTVTIKSGSLGKLFTI